MHLLKMAGSPHRHPLLPKIKIFLTEHVPKSLVIDSQFHMNTIKIMVLSFKTNTLATNSKSWFR